MPITTYVMEHEWDGVPDSKCIQEFLPEARKVLGKRIAIQAMEGWRGRWWRRKRVTLYSVLLDIGHGEAQVMNFAPRDGSDWSINTWVPEQEVSAYLMGMDARRSS